MPATPDRQLEGSMTMFNRIPKMRPVVLIATVAATALSPLHAARPDEKPVIVQADPVARSEIVSFAALDLNRADHRKMLAFRVAGAIERVCDKELGRDGLQPQGYYRCETGAWSRAQPQIDRAVGQALAMGGGSAAIAAVSIAVSAG